MTTDLATTRLTDKQIQTRIELYKEAGWGLEKGTAPQLNLVFLLCQKFELLPGDDVTLYDGKPWITIDGRVKLMRRQPEYRGHSTRPLTTDEKELWGYDPDDLVVEATVRTVTFGEIKARGKVSKAERSGQGSGQRLNPVARVHPVEMAEKRAIARAERFAFGTDAVVDEEDAEEISRVLIEERTNPERVAENAAMHDRIFQKEYGDERPRQAITEEAVAEHTLAKALQLNEQHRDDCRELGIRGVGHLTAKSDWPLDRIMVANDALEEKIRLHHAGRIVDSSAVEELQLEP